MNKHEKRLLKMANLQAPAPMVTGPIDCACVIHGDAYDWNYVEKLYAMLARNITVGIRMHVYTEETRPVPAPMIKHVLTDWGLAQKQAWWYKMQLFDCAHHSGPLLYFDLDTVVVNNIDWIWQLSLKYFWSVRDFKYLWRPTHYGINSSVMWWDTQQTDYVWQEFIKNGVKEAMKTCHGDQDYITAKIIEQKRRYFDVTRVHSWRWQCLDGGYNFKKRHYLSPNSGTAIDNNVSVVVFHGKPKPAQVADPAILQHWQ